MTRRRYVEAGRTTGNDRRTTRRHHLFTPDPAGMMAQIFWYCLGIAAQEFNVTIHAAMLLSTHPHTTVSDNEGNLPDFRRRFHRLLAMCTKAFRGWPEEVFNKAQAGEHELLTPKAMVRNLAYLIANPVLAGAVRYAKDWPGAKTLARDIGRRVVRVPRPPFYLDPKNPIWPEWSEVRLEMPQMLIDHYGSLENAQRAIEDEVKRLEREALRKSKELGRPFAGARRVLRTKHTARARSHQDFGSLNPRFAAGGDVEAARAAIQRFRAFDADYDAALARWTAGDRDVCFPHGTWWMRVHHGVRCHPPP
ncbi:MAG: transposase [Deltaproteobacteria bacterium]|nr:transposase [Deltaproteobacteria bacterium]